MTITSNQLFGILVANPYPGSVDLRMSGGTCCFTVEHVAIGYNINGWLALGRVIPAEWTISGDFLSDAARVHAEIDRVLNIAKQTHAETQTMTAKQLSDILSNHPYPGATNLTGDYDGLMGFNVGGFGVVYDRGMWGVYLSDTEYTITPNFPSFGELTARDVHAEISRVVKIGKSLHANTRAVATESVSTEQTFVSIDRYRELEAELAKANSRVRVLESELSDASARLTNASRSVDELMDERDRYKSSYDYAQNLLNQIWDATGWPEKFDEPDAIEYIKRLKSKADRAGLLSVVCRRLCGDENASIETVHAAIDRCHDEATTIEFIGERLGIDPDGMDVTHLGEIRSLVAQTVKSLSEKTVEVAKLQEGIKNYEAQLKGYAANKRLQEFARIQTILNNAGVATVYDDEADRSVPTDERVRILCERLKENVVARRDDGAKMHQLSDEIRQAHLTLNDLNAARCMGTIDLSLSARIRSVFQTHTKV